MTDAPKRLNRKEKRRNRKLYRRRAKRREQFENHPVFKRGLQRIGLLIVAVFVWGIGATKLGFPGWVSLLGMLVAFPVFLVYSWYLHQKAYRLACEMEFECPHCKMPTIKYSSVGKAMTKEDGDTKCFHCECEI